jgi:acyl carrier protein
MTSPPTEFVAMVYGELPWFVPGDPMDSDAVLFDLGLDSLSAVAIMVNVEDHYGVSLDEALTDPDLFSTIRYLWNAVDRIRQDGR